MKEGERNNTGDVDNGTEAWLRGPHYTRTANASFSIPSTLPPWDTMTVDNVPKVTAEVEIDEYKSQESNSNTLKSRWVTICTLKQGFSEVMFIEKLALHDSAFSVSAPLYQHLHEITSMYISIQPINNQLTILQTFSCMPIVFFFFLVHHTSRKQRKQWSKRKKKYNPSFMLFTCLGADGEYRFPTSVWTSMPYEFNN